MIHVVIKWAFYWFIVFATSITALWFIDFVPPEIRETLGYVFDSSAWKSSNMPVLLSASENNSNVTQGALSSSIPSLVNPVRVSIPSIEVNAPVINPTGTSTEVLDAALLNGVVHYPGSGSLGDDSNILLFGHSSYLPLVQNHFYKSFNRLGEVKIGDDVHLFSNDREYLFKVSKVELVDENEALVKFSSGKKKVTLSTCNAFGKKSERFVVEATFLGSRPVVGSSPM